MPLDEVLPLFIWIDKLDRWKEADKLNLMEGRYKLHETNDRVSVLHMVYRNILWFKGRDAVV